MCGISVIVTKDRDYHDKIKEMTNMVKHRGPDAEGYFQDGSVSMGHRRLKIIDLSDNANQPMEYDGCWIVFNGEIYNYKGLRTELAEKGHVFKTASDTEIILHLYRNSFSVPDMLNRIRGMFAFVIYDSKTNEIIAARDRFGIKPLYWREIKGGVAIGSEIKQFSILPNWKPIISPYTKDDFLLSGVIDHKETWTMFFEVFQIPPGCYSISNVNKEEGYLKTRRWYDLKQEVERTPNTSTFLTVQWLLKCSVDQHLQADVPVGSCLSGGIDSTSIVCMVNRIKKNKQFTVSARSIAEFDEGSWIDIVQKYCPDIERHDVFPTSEELFEKHSSIVYHQDSPIPTTSMFAQWKVFEEASKRVKVMLDGQGSDEIFGGYHMFFGARFASLLRGGHLYTLLNEMNAAKKIPGYDQTFTIKCGLNALKTYPSVAEYSYAQVTRTSLPALLHWEDRNSMAHSVEARVPFLDHKLVEYVMALPEEKKVSGGTTKVILREAMRGLIPDEIVNRKDKIGFQTPERYWFEYRTDLFSDKYKQIREKLPHTMRSSCDDIIRKRKPYTSELWRAISFGEFCNTFGVIL